MRRTIVAAGIVMSAVCAAVRAETPAERGYRWLLERPYVPAWFDQETIDKIWQVWPEPLRSRAAVATPDQRRHMIFDRYGLTARPHDSSGKPLQFVVNGQGQWTPNCFTCHGGELLGRPYPGLPNNRYAIQTLVEEARNTKLRLGKSLAPIDFGSLVMPLGGTRGTTNAVIFGVGLSAYRNPDLTLRRIPLRRDFVHHDMDAPPWWYFRKKDYLYLDGFAPRTARSLMQFALDRSNGPEQFSRWEPDFEDIYAYLMSIEPPKYPFAIDHALAEEGRTVFERTCAKCHGTYGPHGNYPGRIVPLAEIGTDPARFHALQPDYRREYAVSWFGHFGSDPVRPNPPGYLAPPLDGIWASAPYFHNGSVPTLWHVLHRDGRPVVWRRLTDEPDRDRVGLRVEELADVPNGIADPAERRSYFDTRGFGKSAAGHEYPEELTEIERQAVLEYLKTL